MYYHSIGYCDPCWYNLTIVGPKNYYSKSFFSEEATINYYQYNLDPGIYTWKLYLINDYNYANVPKANDGFQHNRNFFSIRSVGS